MCARPRFLCTAVFPKLPFFHPPESCFQPFLFYADPDWLLPVGSDAEPSDFPLGVGQAGPGGLAYHTQWQPGSVLQIPAESLLSGLALGTQHRASDFRQEQRQQTGKLRVLSLQCGVYPEEASPLKTGDRQSQP